MDEKIRELVTFTKDNKFNLVQFARQVGPFAFYYGIRNPDKTDGKPHSVTPLFFVLEVTDSGKNFLCVDLFFLGENKAKSLADILIPFTRIRKITKKDYEELVANVLEQMDVVLTEQILKKYRFVDFLAMWNVPVNTLINTIEKAPKLFS